MKTRILRCLNTFLALVLTVAVMTIPSWEARADTTIGPPGIALVPANAGGTFADSTTTTGTAVMLWSPGSFSMSVTTTTALSLKIRARAQLCNGSPVLTAKVDGVPKGTIDVASAAWSNYTVTGTATAGNHTLTLEYANDYSTSSCDRNVYLDNVINVSGAAPAACPVNQFQAKYFNNTTLTGTPVATRCEFAPGGTFPASPLAGVNANNFSVEYTASLNFPATAQYNLSVTLGNVGARMWFDNALLVDRWTNNQWGTNIVPTQVSGGVHQFRAAFYNVDNSESIQALFGFAAPRTALGATATNGNYFSPTSFWNTPIPAGATVDSRSSGWVTQLDAAVTNISVNDDNWSTTVYNAPASTPTAQITVTNASNKKLTIPYLPAYKPTTDGDHHLAVIDNAKGCLYEFQGFDASNKTAIASASYHVNTGSGGHLAGPAHSGGEFSYLAGMITPQDVSAGVIDHALRFAIPTNSPNYVYPGTRSDGTMLGGVPEGIRIQLDPNLNLASFGLSPFQTMVATALKTYGAFNADGAESFALYAQSTQFQNATYNQNLADLPDALIQHIKFLTPTISSTETFLDRANDTTCNQQQ